MPFRLQPFSPRIAAGGAFMFTMPLSAIITQDRKPDIARFEVLNGTTGLFKLRDLVEKYIALYSGRPMSAAETRHYANALILKSEINEYLQRNHG
jgi:hypothetical protein